MKTRIITCGIFLALIGVTNGRAANITYNLGVFAVGTGSVTGDIVTDGTIGPLTPANLVDWNLVLNDGEDIEDLTALNSSFAYTFPTLSATSTDLSFDFAGPGDYQVSGGGVYLSLEGGIASFSNAIGGGWSIYDSSDSAGLQYAPEGSLCCTIGTAAAPEPSSGALWRLGAAAIALLRRSLRKGAIRAGASLSIFG